MLDCPIICILGKPCEVGNGIESVIINSPTLFALVAVLLLNKSIDVLIHINDFLGRGS